MKLRVLVIDGMQISADRLAESLSEHGYASDAVYSGDDAIRVINAWNPDIILLDDTILHMEGKAKSIEILEMANCPIILMTPYMQSNLVPAFIENGGRGCVMKACTTGQRLMEMISRVISSDRNTPIFVY